MKKQRIEQNRKLSVDKVFICAALLLMACQLFSLVWTRGRTWRYLIWNGDTLGIYPDLFESIGAAMTGRPYAHSSIYPAFAYFLCYCLGRLMPAFRTESWYDVSTTREAIVVEMLFFVVCFCALIILVNLTLKKNYLTKGVLLTFFFCSAPFVYMFERGNMVFLSMVFVFMFLYGYTSESKLMRHISYICLALAAALKIYPAILGLLLVDKRHIKELPWLVLYGVICFFAPFILFGGLSCVVQMMKNALYLNSETSIDTRNFGYGFKVNIQNSMAVFSDFTGINLGVLSTIIPILLALALVLAGLAQKEQWKKIACFSLILVLIPSFSWIYNAVYMLPAFILFLNESRKDRFSDYIYLILFILIFAALPYGQVCNGLAGVNKMTLSTVFCSISLCGLTAMLVVQTVMSLIRSRRTRNA